MSGFDTQNISELVKIVPKEEVQKAESPQPDPDALFRRKIGVVEADIESNCIEHGVRGILKHADIMNMISEYTEEDKQARVYGKFQHLTGLVFKTFSRRVHVKKAFTPSSRDFNVVELVDPHPRNPDMVLWVAFDTNGTAFVIDELFEKFASVDDMSFKIKQRGSQYRIVKRLADPSMWTPSTADRSSVTLADRLRTNGLSYTPASKQRTMGVQLIQDALFYQAEEVSGILQFTQQPMLYVFENCERTIFEFEHWQYHEYSGKSTDSKDRSEKPMDKDDHAMECLGRFFLDQPTFREYEAPTIQASVGRIPRLDPNE